MWLSLLEDTITTGVDGSVAAINSTTESQTIGNTLTNLPRRAVLSTATAITLSGPFVRPA